ncbi:MAG: WD40 repeat domain-containing protein, partial [Chloroflexales bacterium]|nr:WD40 repeat domain-containing protein [Chloroflexales bacterium]
RLTIDTITRTLEPVKRVLFSADGAMVVAGTESGAVLRWAWSSGELRVEIMAHHAAISAMAVTPGGGLLTAGRDGDLRRWNADGARIDELDGLPALSAVAAAAGLVVTGGEDGDVALWDSAGKPLRRFAAHAGPVDALAAAPDGALLASGGDDGILRLWSLPDGAARGDLHGHQGPILALAFDSTGSMLASSGWDGTIRLWAMPEGRPVATIAAIESDGLSATAVLGVTFADAGRIVAGTAYDGAVRRFSVADGAPLGALETGAGGWLIAIAAGSQGIWAALDDSGMLWAWGADGQPMERGALADATALAPLPGGRLLTVGPAGGLRLWVVGADGPVELTASASMGDRVTAGPGGKLIVISSRSGLVEVWSIL